MMGALRRLRRDTYVNGVEFPDSAVGALLAGCGEVGERQLIPVEALMSGNVGRVEDGEGEARKAAHVYFIGGQPSGGTAGVVVGALDARELYFPIGLLFVADHGEH